MVIDWGIVLLIGLGILMGGIAFSASFRKKFFVGLRKFIGGMGSGQKSNTSVPNTTDEKHVKRNYVRTIRLVTCPTCRGKGKVRKRLPAIADSSLAGFVICPTCGGSGEVEEGIAGED